jgi:hypothetical protein
MLTSDYFERLSTLQACAPAIELTKELCDICNQVLGIGPKHVSRPITKKAIARI